MTMIQQGLPQWLGAIQSLGRRKIGLLGGSFDPPHRGHVNISLEALKRLGLDEVWWLVSPQNPLKTKRSSPIHQRVDWCLNLVRYQPHMRVVSIESELNLHFTIDTLNWLKKHMQRSQFVLLLGADNWLQLPAWKEWQKLVSMVHVAVFDRAPWHVQVGLSHSSQYFKNARYASVKEMMNNDKPGWVLIHQPLAQEQSTILRRMNVTNPS